ncbi:MAG: hypothetical protein V3R30_12710, partial [Kiloniellales bacterium]
GERATGERTDMSTHEDFSRSHETKRSSDRGFGLVFAAVFAVIGLWPLIGGGALRRWALAVVAAFLAVALVAPRLLGPGNRLWTRFGLLLHRLAGPVLAAGRRRVNAVSRPRAQ